MSRSIPPLLSPYLSLPSESSLILLTSVLGAGTNWLVLRYLSSLLSSTSPLTSTDSRGNENGDENGEVKVVFLSFMRDMAFWREGARKIVRFCFEGKGEGGIGVFEVVYLCTVYCILYSVSMFSS